MGFLFAFLSALGFATNNIMVKKGMNRTPDNDGLFTNIFINAVTIALVAVIYRLASDNPAPINASGVGLFIIAGLFTTFLGRFNYFSSVRRIGPSRGSALKNSSPLFTLLFAVIVLGEYISLLPLLGMLILLSGLFVQAWYTFSKGNGRAEPDKSQKIGYLFAITAAFMFGVGQAIRKPGTDLIPDPYFGAAVGALVALISFSIYESRKKGIKTLIEQNFKSNNKFYITAGFCTSFAVLCFFIAVTLTKVSYVGVIAATEPLLTVFFSKFFLKQEEQLSAYVIVSASLVFIGAVFLILFA